jgi:molecular chaperone GrpE
VVGSIALVIDRLDQYRGVDPDFAASIRDELLDALWRVGFISRDEPGGAFDPALDHAVGVAASPAPAGMVVQVLRRGFFQEGWVLRPAQVVLSEPDGQPPG